MYSSQEQPQGGQQPPPLYGAPPPQQQQQPAPSYYGAPPPVTQQQYPQQQHPQQQYPQQQQQPVYAQPNSPYGHAQPQQQQSAFGPPPVTTPQPYPVQQQQPLPQQPVQPAAQVQVAAPAHSSGMAVHGPIMNCSNAAQRATRTSATFSESLEEKNIGMAQSESSAMVCGWVHQIILWVTFVLMLVGSAFGIGVFIIPVFIFTYVLYIFLAFRSPTYKYLRSAVHGEPRDYIQNLQCTPPKMSMHIRCFHTEHYRDSKGHSRTRTVTTHTAQEYITYRFWDDVSQVEFPRTSSRLVRLQMAAVICGSDPATVATIDSQYAAFVAKNTRDAQQTHSVQSEIDGFPEEGHVLLVREGESSGCLGRGSFIFFTIIMMSVPYRVYFLAKTSRVEIPMKKVIAI